MEEHGSRIAPEALTFIAGALGGGLGGNRAPALALLGLYSLMAFMVSRRTQELGVPTSPWAPPAGR